MKKTREQIERDVRSDWKNARDQDTIRRRHKPATNEAIIEAEIRLRLALQELPQFPQGSSE